MLGGHLDSWHGATGATDNAIGCAIMMEAVASSSGWRAPASNDSCRALGRRRRGSARLKGLREEHFGSAENPNRSSRSSRLLERRYRHRADPRRVGIRAVRRRPSRATRSAVGGFQDLRATPTARTLAAPTARRSRRRVAGNRHQPGSDRIQQPHPSREPGYLRADRAGRREKERDDYGVGRLPPGHAGRPSAAVFASRNAAKTGPIATGWRLDNERPPSNRGPGI